MGTDWMWCYEEPREAAKYIDELKAALRNLVEAVKSGEAVSGAEAMGAAEAVLANQQ